MARPSHNPTQRTRETLISIACSPHPPADSPVHYVGGGCVLGEADAVAFCGVAEVAFVVVAEAFVEPLGYSGGVQASAEYTVLYVSCDAP